MTVDSLQESDEVIVSGESSSPHGKQWERASGTVATISHDGHIKFWIGDDKVWFPADKITYLELVAR